MKYRNLLLAVVLLVCLVAVGFFALGGEPGEETPQQGQQSVTGSLRITEICTKNESILSDAQGKFRDYIELYADGQDVCLLGFTLTDGKKTSPPLGDITLKAGQYRVIFLSDDTTGFALGANGGDSIQIKAGDGTIVAQASTTALAADQVMSWQDGNYLVTDCATPGFPNTAEGLSAFREGFLQENPAVVISELLTRNESTLPDEKGIFSDVVELHNVSGEQVDLGNYFLSDSQNSRFSYRLPEITLEPDGYVVVFCDGENYVSDQGHIHASFGISKGESLYLTDSTGGYLSLSGEQTGDDRSWQMDDTGSFLAGVPSLGHPNTAQGVELAQKQRTNFESPLYISEVLLSSSGMPFGGKIGDFVEITNRSDAAVSTAGWFFSDGGDPYSYALPVQELKPGECMVLYCHRNGIGFGLSQGENLMLTAPDYRHAPLVTCTEGDPGQSMSLSLDGESLVSSFGSVSLGYGNDADGCKQYLADQQPTGLMISEVMSSNSQYLRGPYGVTTDWLELYNGGTEAVDLSGYALTDNPNYPGKYQLPQVTLEPGAYYVILLTQDSSRVRKGYDWLPMGLSAQGDQVYLTAGTETVDFVFIPELDVDVAYGRAGGSMEFSQLSKPTPEKANSAAAAVSSDPVAVTAPGCYDGVEYLDVVLQGEGVIYYTTNCHAPNQTARRYTEPIRITQTTVIRAVCYEPEKQRSQIITLTYVLNEGDNLSVVSLVARPDALWDEESGIYVDGPGITAEFPFLGANYHQDWEISANVSLYEADGSGGFSENCGLKIFGGFSRAYAKKSFACMFRRNYGASQLEYPLFGEESLPYYESFVLRAGGQDAFTARMRDELITSLAGDYLGLPVQKYRPVVVYLNGEYWGLYYIREKINANYVAGNFGVEKEEVTLTHWSGGDCPEYQAVRMYAINHDLSQQEHYDYIDSMIDIENYTDFMITQLWIHNRDRGNVKFFTTVGGKWTWVLFDTDISFSDVQENSLENMLDRNVTPDYSGRTFLVRLLKNESYREYYLRRMAWQMTNVWTEENILARIDELQATIDEDMKKDAPRWHASYDNWLGYVENLRSFARQRNRYLIPAVQDYFDLTDEQMKDYGFPTVS